MEPELESLPAMPLPPAAMAPLGQQHSQLHARKHDSFRHFLAGGLAGSFSAIILSPLDIVRTRLQSAGSVKMRPDKLIAHIYRTEGGLAFYRGLVPTILGVGPSRAMYFGFYRDLKGRLAGGEGRGGFNLTGAALHLSAAAVAGLATNTLMSPWWVIRLRLQLQVTPVVPVWTRARDAWRQFTHSRAETRQQQQQLQLHQHSPAHSLVGAGASSGASSSPSSSMSLLRPTPPPPLSGPPAHSPPPPLRPPPPGQGYKGVVDAFLRILREEGPLAFYRGLTASYLGVFETAVQFALYGWVKESIIASRYEEAAANLMAARAAAGSSDPVTTAEVNRAAYTHGAAFLNSGVTKLLASVATYPHEVIRTRMREQRSDNARYHGVVHAFLTVAREEGARGLYGGMSVHLLRTVPNAAILLLVVEKMVDGEL